MVAAGGEDEKKDEKKEKESEEKKTEKLRKGVGFAKAPDAAAPGVSSTSQAGTGSTTMTAAEREKIMLSDEDIQEFREIFNLIDTDNSGRISANELGQLVESVGMRLSPEELSQMVTELDKDQSGDIDFTEFCATMSRDINPAYSVEGVTKAFRTFARNAPPGLIKLTDLAEALKVYLYKTVDHREINDLLKNFEDQTVRLPGVDADFFKYEDYINLMMYDSSAAASSAERGSG